MVEAYASPTVPLGEPDHSVMGLDRLHDALEALSQERSPRDMTVHLTRAERSMLRMAQLIRGSRAAAPTAEFIAALHDGVQRSSGRVDRRTSYG